MNGLVRGTLSLILTLLVLHCELVWFATTVQPTIVITYATGYLILGCLTGAWGALHLLVWDKPKDSNANP